jgi:two-component system, LytTR family, sensor kinase
MKRLFLHTTFWLCYLLIFAWISFLWDRAILINFSVQQLIIVDLKAALLYFAPQAVFAYYLVYFAIPAFVRKRVHWIYILFWLLAILFLCTVIERVFSNYIEIPYLYNYAVKESPILEPRRVTSIILFFGFSSGLMLTIKMVRTQLIAKEREKELIKQKLESELMFLRNQINPHFLMNTLNNIYALARKKSEETAEVVMRLSELLRFMLYESNGQYISIGEEIGMLEDYIALETLRYNERLSVNFQKEVDSECYKITPMLLIPFIENAFKHGTSETRFESYISIDLKVRNSYLKLIVENTTDHVKSTLPAPNIGLKNIKRQLELSYTDYTLNLKKGDNVFIVNLFVNLKSHVKI